jgi:cytochrome c oxidase cbb3-type subunit 3
VRSSRQAVILLESLLLLSLLACNRSPSASSLQEWTPTDHHSVDDGRPNGPQPAGGQVAATKSTPEADTAGLVDLTWRQQCTACHGALGKGDGQMGPMLRAPDLTNPELQSAISDADMAAVIKNGKNRMPKFDLPDAVVAGLVARVRSLRGR